MGTVSRDFFWKRLQSGAGIWLVLFLIVHLLTNAQAALFVGADGKGFIDGANSLESIPFLPVIEMVFLGIPILIHMIWGIQYLLTAKSNSFETDGSAPALPEYGRNRAFTWQRITSWLLVIGIIAHVLHMRFIERPIHAPQHHLQTYMVRLTLDEGLYTLAERLDFKLYNQEQILQMKPPAKSEASDLVQAQERKQSEEWIDALKKRPLKKGQVIAVANNFGTAELLMLRDTFKMPLMLVLYTIFVLAACFHAFNGLWTSLIKWGIILTARSQQLMLNFCTFLMVVIGFLGLAAVWGTYWINLKY